MEYSSQQTQYTEPCSAEPRVFIGQVPAQVTFDDIYELFGKYGTLKERQNSSSEGRKPNKGYAMIFFESWTAAEAAVENENGQTPFGGTRPLIVKIAQPAKAADGTMLPGIAPKKLFIGQVSTHASDNEIQTLFSQYGTVTEYHRLQKGGRSPDCVFIGLSRWSECEQAMDALNNQPSPFDPSKRLTVKFANMQPRDNHRENNRDNYRDNYRDNFRANYRDNKLDNFGQNRRDDIRYNKRDNFSWDNFSQDNYRDNFRNNFRDNTRQSRPYQRRQQVPQLPNSIYPTNSQVPPYTPPHFQHQPQSQYNQPPPTQFPYEQQPPQTQQSYEYDIPKQVIPNMIGSKRPLPGNPREIQTKRGAVMGGGEPLAPAYPPQQQQVPPYSGSIGQNQYYDQYGMEEYPPEPQISQDYGLGGAQNGYLQQQYSDYIEPQQPTASSQYVSRLSNLHKIDEVDLAQQVDPYQRYNQQQSYGQQQSNQYPAYQTQGSIPTQQTLSTYPPQDIYNVQQEGETYNQLKDSKLFVGQIPLDIDEYGLWSEFSKVGDIVDVAVLRTQDGKSRACAFVTYLDRQLAEIAIQTYNMKLPFPNSQKPLTVKLAK